MRILIDASRSINEQGGIAVYLNKLIEHLLKIDQRHHYHLIYFYFQDRYGTKQTHLSQLNANNVSKSIYRIPGKIKNFLINCRLRYPDFFSKKADVFFAPNVLDFGFKTKMRSIVTIYDLTYFIFPEHLGNKISNELQQRTIHACQSASKIIAISESTKNDLISLLNVSEKKITVIPLAADSIFQPLSKSKDLSCYGLPQNFFLTVGTISPRKNLEFLFDVFCQLPLNIQKEFAIVIVGKRGWNDESTFKKAHKLIQQKKVIFLDYVPIEDLVHIYNQAALFLFPSLYEGFGIPVLEAMACGVPTITSNNSSLPEVVGDGGLLLPLYSDVWSEAIAKLIDDKSQSQDYAKKGIIHSQRFSWPQVAKSTLSTIESIV